MYHISIEWILLFSHKFVRNIYLMIYGWINNIVDGLIIITIIIKGHQYVLPAFTYLKAEHVFPILNEYINNKTNPVCCFIE